ncbi:HRDC domain-containing protein [Streptococcus sp. HF-1907]|uniref:HRDC domain-containing protein n=1 Tax=Streptococcus sp. HF-1907 TaxID=2785793 RepID=UPI00189ED282|nr:HRDC domain-containing protein [Streptococcus sp. HF-1907]MBF7093870.1 HRDC domain-containing protein [Streptococcus sp. HF-1907]
MIKGKNTADNRQFGFDRLSTYGLLSDLAETTIKKYISSLVADKFLRVESDYKVLKLTNKGRLELKERQPILAKRIKESKQAQRAFARTAEPMDFDQELFEHLHQIRFELAQDQGVPPFIIFSDVSLKEMAAHQPTMAQEFLDIKGVGAQKLERYGEIFMTVTDDYIKTY